MLQCVLMYYLDIKSSKFNDLDIKYSYQIRAELGKYIIGGGETAELTVLRNGQEVKLYVTF